jgi:MFS transporter, SP family, sugar:H+ symporter
MRLRRTGTNSINYYAPQIFKSIGLKGTSSGLFATGVYGIVKIVMTALGLMFATEQMGRKVQGYSSCGICHTTLLFTDVHMQWSLIIGSAGQAFAMFYIGINQAVNPTKEGDSLTGTSIFAIICVYLFVVFYSFGRRSTARVPMFPANHGQAGARYLSSYPPNAVQTTVSFA